jgi:hypothetical protein
MAHGVVKQHRQLACGGGNGLGLAHAHGQAAVAGAAGAIRLADGDRREAEQGGGAVRGAARAGREELAAGDLVSG